MTGDDTVRQKLAQLAPPLAALTLAAMFALLGLWQLDRAAQKQANVAAFSDDGGYAAVAAGQAVQRFQRLMAQGRYQPERQFLIDRMIVDSRVGYFVITPFEFDRDGPLLLVNRGWLQKPARPLQPADIADGTDAATVRGVAGQLPRVGIRPQAPLDAGGSWPRVAVYPTLDELAGSLGREVLPWVLLLDPQPDSGFVRRWQPQESGPMMHYGYAVQWFAMAIAVIIVLAWQHKKKSRRPAA